MRERGETRSRRLAINAPRLPRVATGCVHSARRRPEPPLAKKRRRAYISGDMLSDIYNRRILELAADIPRLGRLASPDASARAHSKLCGSTVTVDLAIGDGAVTDFAHEVKACALG